MMKNYLSVLIIDDDPTQIAILSAYFINLKVHNIQSVPNAAEALDLLRNGVVTVDLITSDLQMPEMDGVEFLRHLSELKYNGALAIISGVEQRLLDHAAKLAQMYNLNLLGQIKKPLSKAELDRVFSTDTVIKYHTEQQVSQEITPADLTQAIVSNQILPYFQPKIDIKTGRIVGAEVLTRWLHPKWGNISPDIFISYAEENGYIEELTFHLIRQALQEIGRFIEINPKQCFAINLSSRLMNDVELPDRLYQQVSDHGIPKDNVSFEITEDSILNLNPVTLEVLSRFRLYGFDVAIDDFGTGSSNIQTLRDFPYSELKIDKAFIMDATTNAFSMKTVRTAVALARELDMKIVAEGIENIETYELAYELGIEHAQGFLFSKALSAQEYMDYFYRNKGSIRLANLYEVA